jgi:hypothetical protein
VALVLTPRTGVTAGKTKLPPAEMVKTVGTTETVAAYRKAFRIEQPITIARTAKAGETVTIAGVVNYQACDDAVCYPPGAVALSWTVTVNKASGLSSANQYPRSRATAKDAERAKGVGFDWAAATVRTRHRARRAARRPGHGSGRRSRRWAWSVSR